MERRSVVLLHEEGDVGQATRLSRVPVECTNRVALDIRLFGEASLNCWSPSFSLEASHVRFGRNLLLLFRADWVVGELRAACSHFPLLEFLRRFSGKLLTLQPLF